MTIEEAIKVLDMFLHKQCDLERTASAYDQTRYGLRYGWVEMH